MTRTSIPDFLPVWLLWVLFAYGAIMLTWHLIKLVIHIGPGLLDGLFDAW